MWAALKRFWHRLGSPPWFYRIAGPWVWVFGVLAAALIPTGLVWGLFIAPEDYQQADAFRIIYVHVPTAILAQSCYALVGSAGFVYLVWRMKLADAVLQEALVVGASLTALALLTGAIWGRPMWNTWWEWDARTTSMLVLLFLYVGLFALREAIPREDSRARASALLALVGVINLPIIKYSVEWWRTLHQPATFTLTEAPAMPPEMYLPLLVTTLGFYAFMGAVILARVRVELLRRERGSRWVNELAGAAS